MRSPFSLLAALTGVHLTPVFVPRGEVFSSRAPAGKALWGGRGGLVLVSLDPPFWTKLARSPIDRSAGHGPFSFERAYDVGVLGPSLLGFLSSAHGALFRLSATQCVPQGTPEFWGGGHASESPSGWLGDFWTSPSVARLPRCIDGHLYRSDATRNPPSRLHSCSVPRNPGGGLWADAPLGW